MNPRRIPECYRYKSERCFICFTQVVAGRVCLECWTKYRVMAENDRLRKRQRRLDNDIHLSHTRGGDVDLIDVSRVAERMDKWPTTERIANILMFGPMKDSEMEDELWK